MLLAKLISATCKAYLCHLQSLSLHITVVMIIFDYYRFLTIPYICDNPTPLASCGIACLFGISFNFLFLC